MMFWDKEKSIHAIKIKQPSIKTAWSFEHAVPESKVLTPFQSYLNFHELDNVSLLHHIQFSQTNNLLPHNRADVSQ